MHMNFRDTCAIYEAKIALEYCPKKAERKRGPYSCPACVLTGRTLLAPFPRSLPTTCRNKSAGHISKNHMSRRVLRETPAAFNVAPQTLQPAAQHLKYSQKYFMRSR
jgi:hypothetical protein